MIEINNVTLWKCEHCGKTLKRKHAMVKHEIYCSSNPKSIPSCIGCKHIVSEPTTYETCDEEGYTRINNSTRFKCKKFDKLMFPPKITKLGYDIKFPETFGNQEQMPYECDSRDSVS